MSKRPFEIRPGVELTTVSEAKEVSMSGPDGQPSDTPLTSSYEDMLLNFLREGYNDAFLKGVGQLDYIKKDHPLLSLGRGIDRLEIGDSEGAIKYLKVALIHAGDYGHLEIESVVSDKLDDAYEVAGIQPTPGFEPTIEP